MAWAIMVVLECWNGCGPVHSPAYIQKRLRMTSTKFTAVLAMRDQTMRTSFTQENPLRSSPAVYVLPNMKVVWLFLWRFRETNKLCDGENSISLMRGRNARLLFWNNAGTPEKHHKAEEHPKAQTKSGPHYLPLGSWSHWGIKRPHSQRRKKLDRTSHFG